MLEKVAIGVSWMPNGLAAAIYALDMLTCDSVIRVANVISAAGLPQASGQRSIVCDICGNSAVKKDSTEHSITKGRGSTIDRQAGDGGCAALGQREHGVDDALAGHKGLRGGKFPVIRTGHAHGPLLHEA